MRIRINFNKINIFHNYIVKRKKRKAYNKKYLRLEPYIIERRDYTNCLNKNLNALQFAKNNVIENFIQFENEYTHKKPNILNDGDLTYKYNNDIPFICTKLNNPLQLYLTKYNINKKYEIYYKFKKPYFIHFSSYEEGLNKIKDDNLLLYASIKDIEYTITYNNKNYIYQYILTCDAREYSYYSNEIHYKDGLYYDKPLTPDIFLFFDEDKARNYAYPSEYIIDCKNHYFSIKILADDGNIYNTFNDYINHIRINNRNLMQYTCNK